MGSPDAQPGMQKLEYTWKTWIEPWHDTRASHITIRKNTCLSYSWGSNDDLNTGKIHGYSPLGSPAKIKLLSFQNLRQKKKEGRTSLRPFLKVRHGPPPVLIPCSSIGSSPWEQEKESIRAFTPQSPPNHHSS